MYEKLAERRAAYRLVLMQFVMPASFALFKAAIRHRLQRRGPGVSQADPALDLHTHWYSVATGLFDDREHYTFCTLKDAQHASPFSVIQRCILLHYHFKMRNYLSGLRWEPASPALPHPQ